MLRLSAKAWARALAVAVVTLLSGLPAPAAAEQQAGEHELLARIYSPCCYRETLDMHISPVAEDLRIEIHDRLSKGEAPDAIVQDMVSRYGPNVLTNPLGRWASISVFAGTAVLSAGLLVLALRISRRRSSRDEKVISVPIADPDREVLEDRLIDELAELD